VRRFDLKLIPLPKAVPVRGYNGILGVPATHYILVNLSVEGRTCRDCPLVILDSLSQDIIVGRNLMRYWRLKLDMSSYLLEWPEEMPPTPSFAKQIYLPRRQLLQPMPRASRAHTYDAQRRDRLIKVDEKRRQDGTESAPTPTILQRPRPVTVAALQPSAAPLLQTSDLFHEPGSGNQGQESPRPELIPPRALDPPPAEDVIDDTTDGLAKPADHVLEPTPKRRLSTPRRYEWDYQDSLRTMARELSGRTGRPASPRRPMQTETTSDGPQIDISMISATGFHFNMQQRESTVFSVSLNEIDWMISQKELEAGQQEAQLEHQVDAELVRQLLPAQYKEFADVFSKAASDAFPPSRSYDHHIELTAENNLRRTPLWNQSIEELKATKKYLVEHLGKGFISASQEPFGAPVMFVKKPNGGLRFCIDFRKLNAITKKDQYPVPLIDETLARLAKARVYTKLDIRQAFHRIRIDESSRALTTFRTRYGSY
jgi:hypothetical protein